MGGAASLDPRGGCGAVVRSLTGRLAWMRAVHSAVPRAATGAATGVATGVVTATRFVGHFTAPAGLGLLGRHVDHRADHRADHRVDH
ncbi:hypothetical protein C8E97_5090 [Saccharothrix australiensis]|uniref:Uncharacterized protein n=1 Tax=Saccharothrix australiensis TaxID=2072 RepID=A0A495W3U7_9PSEU|nr:hypothetical protein C8E97_5090 [Saccharothrix australiensis]